MSYLVANTGDSLVMGSKNVQQVYSKSYKININFHVDSTEFSAVKTKTICTLIFTITR